MVEKRRRTVVYWLKREGDLWFLVEKRRRTGVYWLKREEDHLVEREGEL